VPEHCRLTQQTSAPLPRGTMAGVEMKITYDITYKVNPVVTNAELDQLYVVSWPNHQPPYDFGPELDHALAYVCAYRGQDMIGFVRLAWDGGIHTFLLEPTVRPNYRRRGIGRSLVERAVAIARERGMEWVHVDYAPHLRGFYRACGFSPTCDAGLIHLR
jgi:GNAT superfamily N-acetyltransferase